MIIILTTGLVLLGYYLNKGIRKYYPYLLGLVSALSITSLIFDNDIFDIITEGFFGLAFILVVMITGALKREGEISKKLRSIRKEYSIFGVILILPHGILYLIEFINGSYATEWFGIIALIIMIPLFITSFTTIRRKMSNKTWIYIQKYAYIAYLLTFIHLLMISEGANLVSYTILFGAYFALKLWNYLLVKTSATLKVAIILLLLFVGVKINNGEITIGNVNSNSIGIEYSEEQLIDGIYYGESVGFNNLPVEVNVTVENRKIIDIEIIEFGGTSPNKGTDFEAAVDELAEQILEDQTTDLDTISGATYSTNGLLEAVEDALSEAYTD